MRHFFQANLQVFPMNLFVFLSICLILHRYFSKLRY
nr:MAG TPA: hypothetical protein [Caudoviricetes sp.]